MHPEICALISDTVYGGRLRTEKTERQRVHSPGLSRCRLLHIALPHDGNSREYRGEAERIVAEIAPLLQGTLTDEDGVTRSMTPDDIIIVTPYNAQRRLIARLLHGTGMNVRVGTVDKFQRQKAFVVFYSMATVTGNDVPRDLGFLFGAEPILCRSFSGAH